MNGLGQFKRARILSTIIALSALAAGPLATAPAAQARTVTPVAAAVRPASTGPASTAPSRLSAAQASIRARQTGDSVVATGLTTPTSETTARPDGSFVLTENMRPVRVWRGGAWLNLNPDLSAGPRKRIIPAATTAPITLSDGGSGPLAVLTSYGRTMRLNWPWRLPVPSLSGPAATYASVIPGADLVVTVTPQGGFSDVLVIHSAAAAANPLLATLKIAVQTPGMQLRTGAGGVLTAATSARAEPVFTALAPRMWDSAPLPAGTPTVTEPDGTVVADPDGFPASSSAAGPGAAAHVFPVAMSASRQDIVLRPPAAGLNGPRLTFPLYLDPSFQADPIGSSASDWTQISEGIPSQSYWNESSDLQLGLCDNSQGQCGSVTVVRFYVRMPVSTALTTSTSVNSADLSMDDVWSDSCTAEPVQIWTANGISSSTTWDNPSTFKSEIQSKSFAFGHDSSCGSFKNDVTWNVTSVIQSDAGHVNNQTFGFKADSESTVADWKQFDSGSSNITMSISYHTPPTKPSGLANEPAGACSSSASSPAVIGDDDVTLSATVGDVDDANGDSSLTSAFTLKEYPSGTTAETVSDATGNAVGGTTASVALSRATMQGLSATSATYSWSVTTKDAGSPALTSPASATCYFTYNPAGPAQPVLSFAPSSSGDPSDTSGPIGTTVSATFEPPPGCGSGSAAPCPTSFTYQLGVAPQITVNPNSSPSAGDWTGNITVAQVGPEQITVYGSAAGNVGASAGGIVSGEAPASPLEDGYYAGGTFPSLLTTGPGTGSDPSLWLSVGSGNGALSPAVDIGDLGTGISENSGENGPAEWSGAQIAHGNLAEQNTQDVLAWYPSLGSGVIIPGSASASELSAGGLGTTSIDTGTLTDPTFASPSDEPLTLAAAGDASELCGASDDLIGVIGDPSSGYELDLFSTAATDLVGAYGYLQTLSTTAPDGTADWNSYVLATAQPGDSSDQTGCAVSGNASATDRNDVILYALDKSTGKLYESVNPNVNGDQSTEPATATPVGSSTSFWAQLSVPWSSAPGLVQADINSFGSPELWTVSGGTATAYTISGETVTQEGSGSSVAPPAHNWPLDDGSLSPTATTAADTVTGTAATVTGTSAWTSDDWFGTVFGTVGSSSGNPAYITPPSGTVSKSDPTVSLWFRTSLPLGSDGILVSLQASALSSGSTTTGGLDPVLYVGTDGKLHALWYQGSSADLMTSAGAANDGAWHHAVLSSSGSAQTLTIDGVMQGAASGTVSVSSLPAFDFGAGYIGGHWPDEIHSSGTSSTGYLTYFPGELADITFSQ